MKSILSRSLTNVLLGLLVLCVLDNNALFAQTSQQQRRLSPVNQRLWKWISHTGLMQIEGSGRLWKKTTGLGDQVSLHIRDKKTMYALLRKYPISNKRVIWKNKYAPDEQGSISVNFMPNSNDINGETIEYIHLENKDYNLDIDGIPARFTLMPLVSRHPREFATFIHSLAKRAEHDRSIQISKTIQGD